MALPFQVASSLKVQVQMASELAAACVLSMQGTTSEALMLQVLLLTGGDSSLLTSPPRQSV